MARQDVARWRMTSVVALLLFNLGSLAVSFWLLASDGGGCGLSTTVRGATSLYMASMITALFLDGCRFASTSSLHDWRVMGQILSILVFAWNLLSAVLGLAQLNPDGCVAQRLTLIVLLSAACFRFVLFAAAEYPQMLAHHCEWPAKCRHCCDRCAVCDPNLLPDLAAPTLAPPGVRSHFSPSPSPSSPVTIHQYHQPPPVQPQFVGTV